MKKAQSAMEYLMTYGWAILIVIIVAAALYALGVFNPATYTTASATGFQGFLVPTGGFVVNSSGVHVLLRNGQGTTVQVESLSATVGGASTTANESGDWILSANEEAWFRMYNGVTYPSSGTAYSIPVSITYTFVDTGAAGKSSGTLTGTAV